MYQQIAPIKTNPPRVKNMATGTFTYSVIAQENIDNVYNYAQESSKTFKPSMFVPKGCVMFAIDVILKGTSTLTTSWL